MKKLFDPGTRLIIVFILTVVISGGILTYLSINSISNFKELTEKKVTEEQRHIADQVSMNFQKKLEELAGRFISFVLLGDELNWAAVKLCDTLDFIENPFIISKEKEFLWPWFLEDIKVNTGEMYSTAFLQDFSKAEKREFQARDYKQAAIYYRASFNHASGKSDSAKSLNALARVNLKMKDNEKAYFYYSEITANHFSVLDNNGFPYAYYAIPNLLKFSDSTNFIMVIEEIESFLFKLANGTIPLNRSTADILSQISNWDYKPQPTNDNQLPVLEEYIQIIDERISFINNYGNIIKESLLSLKDTEYQLKMGNFNVLNGISPGTGKIVLIDPDREYTMGFCLNLNQIWSSIMRSDYCENTEFEYIINLIEKEESNSHNNNKSGFITEFSSYYPTHMVWVSLKDTNLVDTYVKKRSWTYGIALVLLLGAMFLGVLLILRDILREKRLSRLRSDFVSNVTHELKTPLTSIHLFTESIILDRVKTTADKKEYLYIILKETERLKRMINNILDFSKREKDELPYNLEKVDVTALVRSALNDLDYWLVEKKFTVETRIEENICATADADALKQAIINLLSNAIKFSRNKKEIFVRLRKEKEEVIIEVEDKGIGIPEDQKDLIFNKFYRVEQKKVEDVTGTGLGLTVVKEIIEGHNGKILVESILNEGSKFTFILNSFQENIE